MLTSLQAAAMAGLTLTVAAMLLAGLHGALRRSGHARPVFVTALAGLGLAAWLALTGGLAAAGLLSRFEPPPPVLLLAVAAFAAAALLVHSRTGRHLLAHTPEPWPIALQTFRVPVEVLLFWYFAAGVVPVQMTFEGLNFDVLSGLLAPVVAWGVGRWPRAVAVGYNVLGLALLFTIVGIAVLSVPGPMRVFMNEPANAAVGTFPFVWLPTFLVPVAFFGHVASLRQLLGRRD